VRKILLAVTNDLVTDHRVHKVASSLQKMGFEVTLLGRRFRKSGSLSRPYQTRRFRLLFNKGPLFYAIFNIRLFFHIVFGKYDVLVANDLDTLPGITVAASLRKLPVIYDSHELFTEVPEVIKRPWVQGVWRRLEKLSVPHVHSAYTVSQSISECLSSVYRKEFTVIRNMPRFSPVTYIPGDRQMDFGDQQIILYQGALNMGRGLEMMVQAMKYIPKSILLLAGDGDKKEELQELVIRENLGGEVIFLGRLSLSELHFLTPQADLGISLEEDLGLSYHFVLPNKLFDYIHAGIPVLVSDLPEMRRLVENYNVGEILKERTPKAVAQQINELFSAKEHRRILEENASLASRELCWENEEKKLAAIYAPFLEESGQPVAE
jgi:glycosyltransferase involved in cell wall biosynthesis